ncbi:MAG: septal ring lytic transglycosylase RlpA family protein [Microscillaceae bacterium]|nr:septal ring lytic transglycosylase RlpA family protein [Microscillaceae bacterium]
MASPEFETTQDMTHLALHPTCWLLLLVFAPSLAAQTASNFKERGIISYYTDRFANRKTASGEQFDNNDLVGCHSKIPFGTKVKVTNLSNGKSVVIRINDRGPYAYGRIMDISKAAAKKIDLIATGTAKAEIEVIETNQSREVPPGEESAPNRPPFTSGPDTAPGSYQLNQTYSLWGTPASVQGFTVQVGGYASFAIAQSSGQKIKEQGLENEKIYIRPETHPSNGTLFKILLGSSETREQANTLKNKLAQKGITGFVRAFE